MAINPTWIIALFVGAVAIPIVAILASSTIGSSKRDAAEHRPPLTTEEADAVHTKAMDAAITSHRIYSGRLRVLAAAFVVCAIAGMFIYVIIPWVGDSRTTASEEGRLSLPLLGEMLGMLPALLLIVAAAAVGFSLVYAFYGPILFGLIETWHLSGLRRSEYTGAHERWLRAFIPETELDAMRERQEQ